MTRKFSISKFNKGGEVAGFTWNKRYITFYADFFVLMELDDLENWEKENGPNKDMLADYIFLPDVNFSWKRMSEMEIMVTNRSRECTIRVKQKEHCSVILQHLCALKYLAMNNLNGCSSPIKQPISEREAVLHDFRFVFKLENLEIFIIIFILLINRA